MDTSLLTSLTQGLDQLLGKPVLIIGDVMLDRYLFGAVERISPEAPVPIVAIAEERILLGGAGNVAKNIQRLGGDPWLFCICGVDESAKQLEQQVVQDSIRAAIVNDRFHPTTTKTRVIAQHQQVLRIDHESTQPYDFETLDALHTRIAANLSFADVVIFSDYGKGIFTERFVSILKACFDRTPTPPRILVDPKPANIHLFNNVFLLTPNAKEAAKSLGAPTPNTREEIIQIGLGLLQATSCRNVLITLGPNGMALFEENGSITHIPTRAQKVFDVTGAGDTVIATVGLALAAGLPLRDACHLANYAAGLVVGELGTAAVTPLELRLALERLPAPHFSDWTATR